MNGTPLLFLAVLALPGFGQGAKPIADTAQTKAADALETLQAEYQAWVITLSKKSDPAAAKRRPEFVSRALSLTTADPRGELAVRTRVWFVTAQVDPELSSALIDELLDKDLASPELVGLADELNANTTPRAYELLTTLAEKAGDKAVRGRSLRKLADFVRSERDAVRAVEKGEVGQGALKQSLGAARAEKALELGSAKLEAQYVTLLERVVKEYPDVLDIRGRPIGPRAEGVLFEMQHLGIGQIPPDIEAEDIDGAPFKLSDYRGKVVLLDFWGHW